jgi:hypothetical protein
MDVDMEMDDQTPVQSHANHHLRQDMPSRRRSPGWKAQLKCRHSSSDVREERHAKRRQLADERFLATANLLQALSISHPSRPRSAAQSPRTRRDAVQRYNQMLERMRTNPDLFSEVETHRQEPAHADIPSDHDQHAAHQAVNPPSQGQANEQPYAELHMHGRIIRVSYPDGYQRDNPNANLRHRTIVEWSAIANLMVDLHAWYDDHAVWLYMCLIAMHSGRRAAILSPLYTETMRQAREINGLFMTARDQSIGILEEPDIIAIPMNMGGNHWVLGIYTRETHTIRYYNTIWAPLRTEIRQALIAVVREFYPDRPDPTISIVPRHAYNQQQAVSSLSAS